MGRTRLTGKRAVVTGASAGIGLAIARAMAAEGADLVLAARRVDRLESLATELQARHGIRAEVVKVDLSEAGGPEALYRAATDGGKPVDVLVNNAGFGLLGPFLELPLAKQLEMMRLNTSALVELTYRFAEPMRARGRPAHVVHIASIAAFQPCPRFAVYGATKSFVRDFSEALAFELRGTCVGVTCVCPGGTESEFHAIAGSQISPTIEKTFMTAEAVAAETVEAMLGRKPLHVNGFLNALGCFITRLVPRRVATWAADLVMRGQAG